MTDMNYRQLVYTHNNAYDSVLLLRHDGIVVSEWTVTPEVLNRYLDEDGATLDQWAEEDLNGGISPGDPTAWGEILAVTDRMGRHEESGFRARVEHHLET